MNANEQNDVALDHFRRWGYLQAEIDPFHRTVPEVLEELSVEGETADRARRLYCGTIGIEFMHIVDSARRTWIQEKMEGERSEPDRNFILKRIISAIAFEQVIQHRYPGTKRFSLEGLAAYGASFIIRSFRRRQCLDLNTDSLASFRTPSWCGKRSSVIS